MNTKGQSLVEVMVAIAIITTGIFSVWTLFLSNFSGEQEARARTVAANLAREGVELVKNVRDSNWLRIDNGEEITWNDGLHGGTAVFAEFLNGPAVLSYEPDSLDESGAQLFLNDGFYTHGSSGISTSLRRLIALTPICCVDENPIDLKCDDYDSFSYDARFQGDELLPDDGSAPDCDGKMVIGYKIESAIKWKVNNESRELTVEDELYNWR